MGKLREGSLTALFLRAGWAPILSSLNSLDRLRLSLLAPGGIYSLPRALANAYAIGQSVCWLAGLVFLAWTARSPVRDRRVIASE